MMMIAQNEILEHTKNPYSNISEEFSKRKPWITQFIYENQVYGGSYNTANDSRLDEFIKAFPQASKILELGSLEGGQTIALRQRGIKEILAIEGRKANIEKSLFVSKLFGIDNIKFVEANLETCNLLDFGNFDAVFCVGVLYHLPNPQRLIEQMSQVSSNVLIWTHYSLKGSVFVAEHGLADPLSGMSEKSQWLSESDLRNAIEQAGFKIDGWHPQKHNAGPAVTIILKK